MLEYRVCGTKSELLGVINGRDFPFHTFADGTGGQLGCIASNIIKIRVLCGICMGIDSDIPDEYIQMKFGTVFYDATSAPSIITPDTYLPVSLSTPVGFYDKGGRNDDIMVNSYFWNSTPNPSTDNSGDFVMAKFAENEFDIELYRYSPSEALDRLGISTIQSQDINSLF